MRIALLLTNDYEVFGNGRGEVESLLVKPTQDLAATLGRWGCPQTLFVDVVEYWRFRQAEDGGRFGLGYRSATLIEEQLQHAILEGHDVQLHVHPQWLTAEPITATEWRVNIAHWRTSAAPHGLGHWADRLSLRGMLSEGKRTLESILRPAKSDYSCIAFRAGGYCIQPERKVLQAIRESGLRIESSVCPGRYLARAPAYFDFRQAPVTLPYWMIRDRVDMQDDTGDLLELPVATGRQTRITTGGMGRKTRLSALRRLILPRVVNLDYCKLSGAELIRMTERYIVRMATATEKRIPLPIVLIGHSKEWSESGALNQYLAWVNEQPEMVMMTVTEWLKMVDDASHRGRAEPQ